MKIVDWKPNTRIFITSGAETTSKQSKWNGQTTDRSPYRDGDVTKVDIIDDDGSTRAVTISRVKYVTEYM
jgi:WD40 repeat protein